MTLGSRLLSPAGLPPYTNGGRGALVPGAAYLEMALAAGSELFGAGCVLTDVEFDITANPEPRTGYEARMLRHPTKAHVAYVVYFTGGQLERFLENQGLQHRLGVTASRKVLGKAVHRNRAKRLLRETFRSNETLMSELAKNYDWVLNAKTAVLSQKVDAPRQELKGIIEKVGRLETRDPVK